MRILLLCLIATAATTAEAVLAAIETDIVHTHRGDRPLHLDFIPPISPAGPVPVLVWIHGGGWRTGHRRDNHEGMRGFAALGYASIAAEYRLSTEATHPAQLNDMCAALDWIVTHASARQMDPQRVVLVGGSAGGHLALLTGFHGDIPQGLRIRAIVNLAGPTHLSFALSLPSGDAALQASSGLDSRGLITALIGSDDRADLAYGDASPLTWVRPEVPPVMTVQGRDDDIVPVTQAQALHAALRAVGATERLLLLDGGHDYSQWAESQRQIAFLSIIGFLAEHTR